MTIPITPVPTITGPDIDTAPTPFEPGVLPIPTVVTGEDHDLTGGPDQAPDVALGRDPTLASEIAILYPWLPTRLGEIYEKAYIEYGDADLAWAVVRASDEYDEALPGMKRDDGSLRLATEQDYFALMESYAEVFRSYNLSPAMFESRFVDLLIGNVSPDELDRQRIAPVYERVIDASQFILDDYFDRYGLEMTPEAIIAGVLDPDLGARILDRQIAISEISGEAAESGFGISDEFIDTLYRAGVDRQLADRLFQQAEGAVPVLSILARRHADPNDEFTLEEFTSSELFGNPLARRRMRRLVAQEQSLFGNVTGSVRTRTNQLGGRIGLENF